MSDFVFIQLFIFKMNLSQQQMSSENNLMDIDIVFRLRKKATSIRPDIERILANLLVKNTVVISKKIIMTSDYMFEPCAVGLANLFV